MTVDEVDDLPRDDGSDDRADTKPVNAAEEHERQNSGNDDQRYVEADLDRAEPHLGYDRNSVDDAFGTGFCMPERFQGAFPDTHPRRRTQGRAIPPSIRQHIDSGIARSESRRHGRPCTTSTRG